MAHAELKVNFVEGYLCCDALSEVEVSTAEVRRSMAVPVSGFLGSRLMSVKRFNGSKKRNVIQKQVLHDIQFFLFIGYSPNKISQAASITLSMPCAVCTGSRITVTSGGIPFS